MPGREWVKLRTNTYREVGFALHALPIADRDACELLHYRAWQYAGAVESGGHVPFAALPELCPRRGKLRAQQLVDAGVWESTSAGWYLPTWAEEQVGADVIAHRREADRRRSQAYRDRKASRDAPRERPRGVTQSEQEVDTAACGGSEGVTPPPPGEHIPIPDLPVSLVIFQRALQAHRLDVGFNKLRPDQAAQLEALIALHGDAALVKVAKAKWRPDAPAAYVNAWLNDFAAMPAPGERLRPVPDGPPVYRASGAPASGVPDGFRAARQSKRSVAGDTT